MEIKGALNVMNHLFTSSFGHNIKLMGGKCVENELKNWNHKVKSIKWHKNFIMVIGQNPLEGFSMVIGFKLLQGHVGSCNAYAHMW